MIQLTSAATLRKAITKARTVKPFVRVRCFGTYTVTNKQTGASYTVECSKRDGKRFAACTCKAGAARMACKHLAKAALCDTGIQNMRAH